MDPAKFKYFNSFRDELPLEKLPVPLTTMHKYGKLLDNIQAGRLMAEDQEFFDSIIEHPLSFHVFLKTMRHVCHHVKDGVETWAAKEVAFYRCVYQIDPKVPEILQRYSALYHANVVDLIDQRVRAEPLYDYNFPFMPRAIDLTQVLGEDELRRINWNHPVDEPPKRLDFILPVSQALYLTLASRCTTTFRPKSKPPPEDDPNFIFWSDFAVAFSREDLGHAFMSALQTHIYREIQAIRDEIKFDPSLKVYAEKPVPKLVTTNAKNKIPLAQVEANPSLAPCIRTQLNKFRATGNIGHYPRFFLTKSLVSIGTKLGDIEDLLRTHYRKERKDWQREVTDVVKSMGKFPPHGCNYCITHHLCPFSAPDQVAQCQAKHAQALLTKKSPPLKQQNKKKNKWSPVGQFVP